MTAQPLRDRQTDGEYKDSRRALTPESGGRGACQRDEKRKPAGKQDRNERNLPCVRAWIDHEGIADPMQACEELAETKSKAGKE